MDQSESKRERSRREVLSAIGVSATVGVAGCNNTSGEDTPEETETSPSEGSEATTTSDATTETATETAAGGAELWTIEPSKDRFYGPAVGNGSVYILMGETVHAYDAGSGESVATASVGYETGRPVVTEGTLYAPAGGQLVALSANESLDEQWRAEGFDPSQSDDPEARQYSFQRPAVTENAVYAIEQWPGRRPFVLYRFDRNTGERRWTQEVPQGSAAVAATGDTVYFANQQGTFLSARNAGDGTERWRYETEDRVNPPPVTGDGTVFVGITTPERSDRIVALDPDTGEETGSIPLGGIGGSVHSDRERFYVAGGPVRAIDRSDRTQEWVVESGDRTTLALGQDRVYAAAGNTVTAYEKGSGDERWTASLENGVGSRPIYAAGTVYVKDRGGVLYAFVA